MTDFTAMLPGDSGKQISDCSQFFSALYRGELLSESVEQKQEKRKHAVRAFAPAKEQRKTSRNFIVRVDNAIRNSLGFGLSRFLPENRLLTLQPGQTRRLAPAVAEASDSDSDGNDRPPKRRRVMLKTEGTDAAMEICENPFALPVLHVCSDLGVGFSATWWALMHVGLSCADAI